MEKLKKSWSILKSNVEGKGGGIRPTVGFLSRSDWENYFSNLYFIPNQQDFVFHPRGVSNDFLDAPFHENEIETLLTKKVFHKAVGPDGLPLDALKLFRFDKTVCRAVANCFSHLF